MTVQVKPGELAPIGDRIRWMLVCRIAVAIAALVIWQAADQPRGSVGAWLFGAVGWPALATVSLFAARVGRRSARAMLTLPLLGDGVLLAAAWWAAGGLDGSLGYLVVLHAVAVTLLASFRTGVKLAVWHGVCALLFLEAEAAGLLGAPTPVPLVQLSLYLGTLCVAVLGTASFAAANERELRRRRYDSEVLREFGLVVVAAPEPSAVAVELARFAREELSVRRAAVLVYVRDDDADHGAMRALGVVTGATHTEAGDDRVEVHRLEPPQVPGPLVRTAIERGSSVLVRRLDPQGEPWLAGALHGGASVVVPFAVDQVFGVLVMQPHTGGRSRRVERRVVNTAEQAAAHAAIALERAVLIERIRAASETDGLTRVANRRRFDEVLGRQVRQTGAHLALVMIDIDHFKRLNDTHGHLVGDEVLRAVAQTIRTECGEPHLVARYGGEEFAAILVGVDLAGARAMAERIRAAISTAPTVTPVTASLGVAAFPAYGPEPADLIAAADGALYRAKQGGRNQVMTAAANVAAEKSSEAVNTGRRPVEYAVQGSHVHEEHR